MSDQVQESAKLVQWMARLARDYGNGRKKCFWCGQKTAHKANVCGLAIAASIWPSAPAPEDRKVPEAPRIGMKAFATEVLAAASLSKTGRFGDRKVFIAHVWRELKQKRSPAAMGDLEAFKARLVEANQAGLVLLSRAELVQVMDPKDLAESLIGPPLNVHFVRLDSAQAAPKTSDESKAINDCDKFASSVQAAIGTVPGWSENRVYISDAWEAWKAAGGTLTLQEFKAALVRCNRLGAISLFRIALVELADMAKLEKSAIQPMRVHLLERNRKGPKLPSINDLVLAAVQKAAQEQPEGTLLVVRQVRKLVPSVTKDQFDQAAVELLEAGKVGMHHHDHPGTLSDAERDGLVCDGDVYYVGIWPIPARRKRG